MNPLIHILFKKRFALCKFCKYYFILYQNKMFYNVLFSSAFGANFTNSVDDSDHAQKASKVRQFSMLLYTMQLYILRFPGCQMYLYHTVMIKTL